MSNGHARRAEPSPTGSAERYRWLVWTVVPLAAILPVAAYMLVFATPEDSVARGAPEPIEDAIRDIKFDPLLPPNRLRGPGAIYAVLDDGAYWKVCDADPELVRDKVRTSPIPNQTRRKLERAGLSIAGDVVETLNARLSAARIVSIEYRMTNVTISEIAMRDLYVIQKELMSDRNCDEMVGELLKRNVKVCPGYAALTASTSYKVSIDSSVDSGAAARTPVIEAVQRQIAFETQGEIKLTGTHELVGQDLYYGIKLSPVCIAPNTATEPTRLDDVGGQPSVKLAPNPLPPGRA
ncbi:MAG: hypothetical protein AB7H90_22715 [Alphaproteobacteria bacterium]